MFLFPRAQHSILDTSMAKFILCCKIVGPFAAHSDLSGACLAKKPLGRLPSETTKHMVQGPGLPAAGLQ